MNIVTFSVVSHGQSNLISNLLVDLQCITQLPFDLIITLNIPEDESIFENLSLNIKIIRNKLPKGFGANHNTAFLQATGKYFIVLNPDIRFDDLHLEKLFESFINPAVGAVGPHIINRLGITEDSIRKFPTISSILKRTCLRQRSCDYIWAASPFHVDWIGGMFMAIRPEAFRAVGGFDSNRFFMYLEDVDLCRRLWLAGWTILADPSLTVVHDAQRASFKNFQHFKWHITSLFRYLLGF